MKLKKFTARSMPEVMQQIRSELGRDAVILKSREIKKGGVLGLFQKTFIEVVAALEPDVHSISYSEVRANRSNPYSNLSVVDEQPREYSEAHEKTTSHILAEIKQMKQLLEVTQSSTGIPDTVKVDYVAPYMYLIEQEVDPMIAEDIVRTVQEKQVSRQELIRALEIKKAVEDEIIERLNDQTFKKFSFKERIIHFIGPTGVGKTTTIAKIAAKAMLEKKKSVAFITTDTYRIAAIEQLKTYARILEVPIEVAYSQEDYIRALQKHAHIDQIFVDTAGRNFRNQSFVDELTQLLEIEEDRQATMLVLSLSTKQSDLRTIFKQFQHLEHQQVIFTKLDETNKFGSMINFVLKEHVQIAFLTNGQDVPQDVIEPDTRLIGSYVMSGYNED